MPAARHFSRSPLIEWAVVAMIGSVPLAVAGSLGCGSRGLPRSRPSPASGSPSGRPRSLCARSLRGLAAVGDDLGAVAAAVEQAGASIWLTGLSSATRTSGAASVRLPAASRSPSALNLPGCGSSDRLGRRAGADELEPERAALAGRAVAPIVPPIISISCAEIVRPRPGAAVLAGGRVVGLREWLEQAGERLARRCRCRCR
jgi:hypothetical protein